MAHAEAPVTPIPSRRWRVRASIGICLVAASARAVVAQQPTPVALTLGDAARLAARQSVPALAAQLRTREAAARVTQRRADLLPSFNALALPRGHTLNSATFG